MRVATARTEFIFSHLYSKMTRCADGHWIGGCEVSTTYDDGLEFVSEFLERWPGRAPDPKAQNGHRRLGALCRELHRDGWLDRFRLGNHDQYHPQNEPNWQFVYSLHAEYAERIRSGRDTAESLARRYHGDES